MIPATIKNLTQETYIRAKTIIPGGTQLLSKRPEMMAPNLWPAYFSKASGCEVWDLDGNHYYDMSTNGIGSCLLGFCDPDVNEAVKKRIDLGNMCTLNAPEEVELAELLCCIHPWADQVRFARTGGETAAVAVRIARATTGRSVIAICGYHGWQDWYLAANLGVNDALRGHLLPGLEPSGVPSELRDTALPFSYNDKQAFQSIIDKVGDRMAAVILEPCRWNDPEPGFLEFIRDRTNACGAMVIYDEITIGWRLTYGGSHLKLGINPDLAIFAKALGNGYPIGAVIGTRSAMEGAHKSFISSTYWTESIGPVAALATLRKMELVKAHEHAEQIGAAVSAVWKTRAEENGLRISTGDSYSCLAHFKFMYENSETLRTLYTQMMLERGFLGGISIYPTTAHTLDIVRLYDTAVSDVFSVLAEAIRLDRVNSLLRGPVAHSGFKRLNG
ncbi:MAG: aminotransferase class III-fold pyridoxal phosphate-dependent enzyme [Bacillota bacterium]|nr:aminotransferase class III-fold pyridoxal phosphate-dependent enzyme [Bacillota bacterium]